MPISDYRYKIVAANWVQNASGLAAAKRCPHKQMYETCADNLGQKLVFGDGTLRRNFLRVPDITSAGNVMEKPSSKFSL